MLKLKKLLVLLCGASLMVANLAAYANIPTPFRAANPASVAQKPPQGQKILGPRSRLENRFLSACRVKEKCLAGLGPSSSPRVYMQARYYDPKIGRFLSPDPVTFAPNRPTFFNRYWYAQGNPYKYTDPDGRCPLVVGCVEAGILIVGTAYALYKAITGTQKALKQHNEQQQESPPTSDAEPGTADSDEGCIYCVDGKNTQSGKDYVGSADDLGKRSRDKSDGRNRDGAKKIDSYKKGDRQGRRNKEQQAINDRGGKGNLDNKRNEVAEKHWPKRDIKPPQDP